VTAAAATGSTAAAGALRTAPLNMNSLCCCRLIITNVLRSVPLRPFLCGLCLLHGSVVSEKEGEMERCLACETLIGRASTVPPHEKLQCSGAGVFGTPKSPITRYVLYRCTSCGCWLKQNTSNGLPAGLWWECDSRAPVPQVPERKPPDLAWRKAVLASVLGRPR
jgi:hypothetical protein